MHTTSVIEFLLENYLPTKHEGPTLLATLGVQPKAVTYCKTEVESSIFINTEPSIEIKKTFNIYFN